MCIGCDVTVSCPSTSGGPSLPARFQSASKTRGGASEKGLLFRRLQSMAAAAYGGRQGGISGECSGRGPNPALAFVTSETLRFLSRFWQARHLSTEIRTGRQMKSSESGGQLRVKAGDFSSFFSWRCGVRCERF